MKRTPLLVTLLLLVPLFELTMVALNPPIMEWFWCHVSFLLVAFAIGVVLFFIRAARSIAYLFLSSSLFAALAGVSVYFLSPLFQSKVTPAPDAYAALAHALSSALSPYFFASIAVAAGLALGWLPAWRYLRSHNVA